MKLKALVLAGLLFMATIVPGALVAQTWHTANQTTIAWDAVTSNVNGGPVAPGEISYVVYVYNAIEDPTHANPIELGPTVDTTYLVTLTTEGRYFFGIKTVRTVDGDVVGESTITWSSDAAYDVGIQYFLAPAAAGGLTVPTQ